jgi:hypothetical protein
LDNRRGRCGRTLTIHSQARDKNTNDFQRETKAFGRSAKCLQRLGAGQSGLTDRVQPTPAEGAAAAGSGHRTASMSRYSSIRSDERGSPWSCFMVLILSVLVSSLMFARTETLSA